MGNNKEVRLKFVHCTDIHGNYFPYDFIRDRSGNASIGSLCRLHTYVAEPVSYTHLTLPTIYSV